jgi:tetratricopeptide (TPR) repeat protein
MSQYLRISIIFGLIILSYKAYSQDKYTDSLQNAIKYYTKKDTVRVNLLNKTATKIFTTQADKALVLLSEAGTMAGDLNYKQGEAYSLLFTGNTLLIKAEYNQALTNFKSALSLYEKLKDKEGMANCYFNVGRSYYYMSDFDRAETNYRQAIALSEETGDSKRLSASLSGIGIIYTKQGNTAKGIETYNKALQLDEKSGNKRGISNNLLNLGNIYRKQGQFPLALDYYNRALDIKEQMADQPGIASCYNNIGVLYERMDKDEEALRFYKKAVEIFDRLKYRKEILEGLVNMGVIYTNHDMRAEAMRCYGEALAIARELKLDERIAICLSNIGRQHLVNKEYNEALSHFEQAIAIYKRYGLENETAFCYLKMASVYYELQQYDKALQFAADCSTIVDKLSLIEYQRDILKLRSQIYYKQKEYKLAYENSAAHKVLNDSIFSKENFDALAEAKYKFEFKDSLNTANATAISLKKTVKVKDAELETSRRETLWWIIGAMCLLIVLGLVIALVKIRRVKMQTKQLLTEQKLLRSQMNPHFIFNSLQNIRSLIANKREEEAVNYLNKFSGLTRQILETSNDNYISLEEEVGIIKNYIAIQQLLYSHPFNYTLEVDNAIEADSLFIPPMLTQPFLENAIKYGLAEKADNGKISIKFYLKEGRLVFEISDNGVGFGTLKKQEGHKSMAINITKKRLANYTKNREFTVLTDNITDNEKNILGAKVVFEIPYIYEN